MKQGLDLQRVQKSEQENKEIKSIGIITWLPELYANRRFLQASKELNLPLAFLTPEQITSDQEESTFFLRLGGYKYPETIKKLKQYPYHYINSLEKFTLYRNKISTLQIWAQKDVPFPKSLIWDTQQQVLKNLQETTLESLKKKSLQEIFLTFQHFLEVGPMAFLIKLPTSLKGQGVFLVTNAEDLLKILTPEILDSHPQLLLQEFHQEASGTDFRALHIQHDIFSIQRKNLQNFKSNLHQGGTALKYELSQEESNLCKKVFNLSTLDYAGRE